MSLDLNWLARILIPIGVGLGLIFGTDEYKEQGVGVVLGALGSAGLTANRTALK